MTIATRRTRTFVHGSLRLPWLTLKVSYTIPSKTLLKAILKIQAIQKISNAKLNKSTVQKTSNHNTLRRLVRLLLVSWGYVWNVERPKYHFLPNPSATHESDSDDSASAFSSFLVTFVDSFVIGTTPGKGPQLKFAGGGGTGVVVDFFGCNGFWCIFVAPPRCRKRLGLVPASLLCEREGDAGDSDDSGSWKGGSDHVDVSGTLPRGLLGDEATDDVEALACDWKKLGGGGVHSCFSGGSANALGGGGACSACVLSRGCLRTLSSAVFSLCAARSAFSAAAVAAAIFGVT